MSLEYVLGTKVIRIVINLDYAIFPVDAEILEDTVATALHNAGYTGNVECEYTGNTTVIRDTSVQGGDVC